MPDVFCKDVCLWVKDVGCRQTRVILLSLEPGSQIWLSVEGQPMQFERMTDGADGRSTRGFKPVGASASHWLERYKNEKTVCLEFEIVERPLDEGMAGSGYFQRESA